jgi:osmotically-inducible protein OsmY
MKTSKKHLSLHDPLRKSRVISFIIVLAVVIFGYSVAARSAEEGATDSVAPAPAEVISEIGPVTEGDTGTGTEQNTMTEAQAIEAASADSEAYEPDNTGVNDRDRDGNTLTPQDQSNAPDDISITQEIRKAVMGDGSLSFTAKNVKIITVGGTVTLRGPVNGEDEKDAIDHLARRAAGVSSVDNQIEVNSEPAQSTDTEQGDAS